ncbi:hypothetical protein MAM1_0565d10931 [Mucor ambiguus]|uniref:Uncharacterized protein n=1 Tax=Mucor ambiguus TaxID=91626 RepID=A0A0C9N5N4_9FUNG|nr:hypothetical protein MAM1_0565d10931 [Mucor ambiguus]
MAFSSIHAASRKRTEPQQDEVEASSILVSLANHHHHSAKKSKTSTQSMSIHNLLESSQQDSPRETQRPVTPPVFSNVPMQMPPEKYIGHGMHPKAQMTIQHNQKSQFQRQANNDKRSFHPAHQQQDSHNRMPKNHAYYHSPPNSTMDYPKHYSKMKCSPKIRRNALQAYISYMTYSDMRRRRIGKTMQRQNIIPPASSPYNNTLMKPDPYASQYRHLPHQHQQQLASPPYHHQQQHHQPPPPPPHPYQQKQHHFNLPPHDSRMRPSYPPQQQQLLSPPPPSPNQRISVQTNLPSSSSAASSPFDKRTSSPPASKVIVDQPLTAFLHHNRPLVTNSRSPPLPASSTQQPHQYYCSSNVPTPSPIARQHNSAFR